MSRVARRTAFGLLALLTCWMFTVACGGAGVTTTPDGLPRPTDDAATESLNRALQFYNEACVYPEALRRGKDFPITVIEPDTLDPSYRYRQLRALAGTQVLSMAENTDGRGMLRQAFSITEEGREARQTVYTFRGEREGICYATPTVTRIDTVKGVRDRSPRSLVEIDFTYAYEEVAPWARDREVQQAFPAVSAFLRTINQSKSMTRVLAQTERGWRDVRLMGDQGEPTDVPKQVAGPRNEGW